MVRIRLRRTGGTKQASYRIVVADKDNARDGRFLEILGHYNPRTQPATIEVSEERVFYWMQNGAQPTDSVKQLFQTIGTMERLARLKAGESMEVLLSEAEAAANQRRPSPKTKV